MRDKKVLLTSLSIVQLETTYHFILMHKGTLQVMHSACGCAYRANYLLELVHLDVCGLMTAQEIRGYEHFVIFIENCFSYGYAYLMHHNLKTSEKF